MEVKQLQAGYFFDCVRECLESKFPFEEVEGLLNQLSFFDLIYVSSKKFPSLPENPIFSVAHNLISRGLPTRSSLSVEERIVKDLGFYNPDHEALEIGSIKNLLRIKEEEIREIFRSLHIVDPGLELSRINKKEIKTWENLGSSFEEDFLYEKLPRSTSPYWVQLLEPQREVENLLRYSTTTKDEVEKYLNGSIELFNEQNLDFTLEFPYKVDGRRGFVIEVDGSQHEEEQQKRIDTNRDSATEKAKWGRAYRIKTRDWNSIDSQLSGIYSSWNNSSFFKYLKENFEEPVYQTLIGKKLCRLSLTPFAIARIQKTIIQLILDNNLDLSAGEWNIAILERDIPCAQLAFEDLSNLLEALSALKGEKINLPKINLSVESNDRFVLPGEESLVIERGLEYDLLIDISILQRSHLTSTPQDLNAKTKVLVRSVHSAKTRRSFKTAALIRYKKLGTKNNSTNEFVVDSTQLEVLEKFVQDIFRKKSFRPGQLEIMNRALSGKSVIGLLPTGSGKSLTYQLTVLLQPGISLVIDPIKSLMKDQYEGLLKNGIDGAVFINSSLNQKERNLALEKIKAAQTLFAFVSPERLQDNGFRNDLLETSNVNEKFFSYCIIDEAHCVSEWGHDFRTSYLRMGDNARNYCLTKTGRPIPFFALTATASYDVLADIQRELKIPEEEAVVRLEDMDRPEIQFKIIEVTADIDENLGLDWDNKKALGEAKKNALINQLKAIPKHYEKFCKDEDVIEKARKAFDGKDIRLKHLSNENFYLQKGRQSNAGLIFCPHRKWHFGVIDNANIINEKLPILKTGTFFGSDGAKNRDVQNEDSQNRFVNHELDLLIATKAFGMGIDKPNIRYVIHSNYPSSIESYYQEAGRAGRDRKLALGLILFNNQKIKSSEKIESVTEDGEISETLETSFTSIDKDILESFHRNNFKGIAKEKNLLAELLTEIKFPSHKILNSIEDQILEQFAINIRLNPVVRPNGRKILYLNPDLGSIYLDRAELPYYPKDNNPVAQEIAVYIKELINTNKPLEIDNFTWLSQHTPAETQPGIEKLLEDSKTKNDFQIIVPFTNNGIEAIANFLCSNGFTFTDQMVLEAQKFCLDKSEFVLKLEKEYSKEFKNKIEIPEYLKPRIHDLFHKIRKEEDTYKAIYRLSIIGIVDDYTVDYNSKTIVLHITKKPKGHYTQKLKEYLLQYNSPEKTDEKLKRLPFFKGKSEIQKCLGFLIKFVYEETAVRRKASIDAMEQACIIGLEKDGSEKFKEFINLYMNSKYARPQYLPADTDKGLKADFDIVLKYMDLVRTEVGEINNFKHLRGATALLLVQRPDNYVFLLLNAFSVLILEKENINFISKAQEYFVQSFELIFNSPNENIQSVTAKIKLFKERLYRYDWKAIEHIEDVESALFLKLHTGWIQDFNKKHTIDNYARPRDQRPIGAT